MTPVEIVEQIMTQHWDMVACRCWVCESGREAGCRAREQYLHWRGKLEYVRVPEPTPTVNAIRFMKESGKEEKK